MWSKWEEEEVVEVVVEEEEDVVVVDKEEVEVEVEVVVEVEVEAAASFAGCGVLSHSRVLIRRHEISFPTVPIGSLLLSPVHPPLSTMPPKAAVDQETAITRCVADIVAELIACKRKGGPMPAVDGLKSRMARKHGVNGVPKLSDIVAAVPDVDRKALLP